MQGSNGTEIGGNWNDTVGDLTIGDNVKITAITTRRYSLSAVIGGKTIGDIKIGGNANVTATNADGTTAAAIGGGDGGTVGNISIVDNAIVNATTGSAAGIGSGQHSSVGDISIGGNATVIAKSRNAGAGIGSAPNHSSAGNISIGGNAIVTATSFYGAGIGCGSFNGSLSFSDSSVGDITISSSATVNAYSKYASDIGAGYADANFGTISNRLTTFDITLDLGIVAQIEPQGDLVTSTITVDKAQTKEISGNPLRIQSGTTSDDFINIFIEDMRTKALGAGKIFDDSGNLLNGDDINRYNALNHDSTKQTQWLETLKAAENKTLDDISVTTKKNANIAIRVIDGALEYAINQAANLGAMETRLGYTADNLTTENENTQAAESTIRDADIPKTISRYAKYILLTQTAQIMLVQANQNSNAVLGLLR